MFSGPAWNYQKGINQTEKWSQVTNWQHSACFGFFWVKLTYMQPMLPEKNRFNYINRVITWHPKPLRFLLPVLHWLEGVNIRKERNKQIDDAIFYCPFLNPKRFVRLTIHESGIKSAHYLMNYIMHWLSECYKILHFIFVYLFSNC